MRYKGEGIVTAAAAAAEGATAAAECGVGFGWMEVVRRATGEVRR